MTPGCSSRPLSRLSSSRSIRGGRFLTPPAPKKGLARRPISVNSVSARSRRGSDLWTAEEPESARLHTEPGSEYGEDEIFGRFNDNLDHVVLAVEKTRKNIIGASYYVAREGALHIMEDVDSAGEETVSLLQEDIQPTIIILSPHNQGLLEQDLRQQDSLVPDNDEANLPYKIEMRPLADFKYELALHKLSNLSTLHRTTGVRFLVPGEEEQPNESIVEDEVGMTDERGRSLHISGSVNLESRVSVGCAGAIITYLQRKKASEYLHGDPAADAAYPILRLETFSLKNTMLVNLDTLAALQIIQPESHPNTAKQGPDASGSKESLSVYGLFYRFARTPQGKQRLRHILLYPSLDIEVIKERQKLVGVFSKAQNQTLLPKLSKSLAKIKNMRRTLVLMHKGIEGGNSSGGIKSSVWSSLLDLCYHIIDVSETITEVIGVEELQLYQQVSKFFRKPEFQRLGKLMFDVVDLDESQRQRRTVVKRGINEDLDRVKDGYDGMDEMLQQAAIDSLPELGLAQDIAVPALNVIYLPQLGFLVLLPLDDVNRLAKQGIVLPWERMFTTEKSAYFKTTKTRQMDAELGDIWAIICDIEIEISHDLAQKVLEQEDFIIAASDLCGELDALLALAHGAIEYNLVRPRVVKENLVDIRAGRHLLQEMAVPHYVPNDAFLAGYSAEDVSQIQGGAGRSPSMLLLTGPNFSGKSVYLKQVALIVYMAQVGSFVPAEAARLGITDKILTRITSRETVSKCQSSFMVDLQQISWALKGFTDRSLLVIDEFGKGTDNCDGAGLAAGVFTYILSGTQQIPKVMASTHFHEIFEQGLMAEDLPGLDLRQMEVKLHKKQGQASTTIDHESEVTYLYNVKPGRSTLSYGAQCAAMNGIPKKVVRRACELTKLAVSGEDLVSACSYIPQEEMRGLEEAESMSRGFLSIDLNAVVGENIEHFKSALVQLIDQSCSTSSTGSTGTRKSVTTP